MTKQEQQKFISNLIRIETKLARIESKQEAIYELLSLNGNDAETIADLQRRLKDANDTIRNMELEKYLTTGTPQIKQTK